jgi:hypothetical protein
MHEIYKDVGKIETDKEVGMVEEITYLFTYCMKHSRL